MERLEYSRRRAVAMPLAFTLSLLAFGNSVTQGQDAVIADYKQNCLSCHTIGGGRITGPDLQNVDERKDREWLVGFVMDPLGVLNSGDEYALKIKQEAQNVVMPNVPGMTRERAEALLDLIAAESKLEKSQFVGVQISDRPLTAADVQRGRGMFMGTVPFAGEGAACVSCHVVTGLGGLGGGKLGPDLTKIFERRQGRKGLVAWLSAPATPVMQATFRDHPLEGEEILGLVAFFRETAQLDETSHANATLMFIILGVAGTVGVLIVFGWIWGYRFRSVRRTLLQKRPVGEPV